MPSKQISPWMTSSQEHLSRLALLLQGLDASLRRMTQLRNFEFSRLHLEETFGFGKQRRFMVGLQHGRLHCFGYGRRIPDAHNGRDCLEYIFFSLHTSSTTRLAIPLRPCYSSSKYQYHTCPLVSLCVIFTYSLQAAISLLYLHVSVNFGAFMPLCKRYRVPTFSYSDLCLILQLPACDPCS